MDDRASEAARTKFMYLGSLSTVADAEEVGVMLAWEECDIVALDHHGAIQRIWDMQYCQSRPWIEERLKAQMVRPRALMWVRGHTGVEANEQADARAREGVGKGVRMGNRTLQRQREFDKRIRYIPKRLRICAGPHGDQRTGLYGD